MSLIHRAIGLALAGALVVLTGCNRPEPVQRQQSFVFGTLVEVTVYGEETTVVQQSLQTVLGEFDRLHRAWHPWEPGAMETINTALAMGRRVPIDAELAARIEDARKIAIASDHLFNPAIGNLVRLWGFHNDAFTPRLPEAGEQARLTRAQPRLTDLVIKDGKIHSTNPAVRIDLGGYAKGYALDLAAQRLREAGIRNALINIGGNVMALGRRGDRPWHIAIQHPRRPGILAELDLLDGEAVGTSGDYQRFFELKGKRYCHLLDPRSGGPVEHTQAITVLTAGAHAGVRSDALSKPLFVAGPHNWLAMAQNTGITHALRVDAHGHVTVTSALAARLKFAPDIPAPTSLP